jgi:hypothetical protein
VCRDDEAGALRARFVIPTHINEPPGRDKMKTMLYFTHFFWYEEAALAC